LAPAFRDADRLFVLGAKDLGWDPAAALAVLGAKVSVVVDVEQLLRELLAELRSGDHVVLMSNGGFQGLPLRLQQALEARTHVGS
jgi:UDP-N-acetylmuramate: L-alanyl-gamma-D-glutamyl-meso-diaminopimelate ligase